MYEFDYGNWGQPPTKKRKTKKVNFPKRTFAYESPKQKTKTVKYYYVKKGKKGKKQKVKQVIYKRPTIAEELKSAYVETKGATKATYRGVTGTARASFGGAAKVGKFLKKKGKGKSFFKKSIYD